MYCACGYSAYVTMVALLMSCDITITEEVVFYCPVPGVLPSQTVLVASMYMCIYLYGYGLVYIQYSHMFVWCESGLYSTVGEC
jgi:hypothetical protein